MFQIWSCKQVHVSPPLQYKNLKRRGKTTVISVQAVVWRLKMQNYCIARMLVGWRLWKWRLIWWRNILQDPPPSCCRYRKPRKSETLDVRDSLSEWLRPTPMHGQTCLGMIDRSLNLISYVVLYFRSHLRERREEYSFVSRFLHENKTLHVVCCIS